MSHIGKKIRMLAVAGALSGISGCEFTSDNKEKAKTSDVQAANQQKDGAVNDVRFVVKTASDAAAGGGESGETELSTAAKDLETKAQAAMSEADRLGEELMASGVLTKEELEKVRGMMERDDKAGILELIKSKGAEGHEESKFILLLSFLGLAYFANMMYRCAFKGGSISFLKHHIPFALGLIALGTQESITADLITSAVAFFSIMLVTRASRGVVNQVDLSALNEEEAKSVVFSLGWLGSMVNSLTTATVLSPLAGKMNKRDRYIAMQNLGNIDGAVGLGAFPGLVALDKLGPVNGPLFQLGLMAPIMLFQKIYQAILWRPKLIKHAGLIWKVLTGMRYDIGMLGKKNVQNHERHFVEEISEDLSRKLAGMKTELGEDYAEVLAAIDEGKTAILSEDLGKDTNKVEQVEEYKATTEARHVLEEYLKDPQTAEDMGNVATAILSALHDGRIKREEVLALKKAGDLEGLHDRIKGYKPNAEDKVNGAFSRFCKLIAASHNETEIMRVFTVQAMAVPLLIPGFKLILEKAPAATEGLTGLTTGFADNWAACALAWGVDPAKALAVAICLGGATIYGNMPNLNWLGKDGDLGDSVKAAKYLIPTGLALLAYLNFEVDGKTLAQHAAEFGQNIPANAAMIANEVAGLVSKITG